MNYRCRLVGGLAVFVGLTLGWHVFLSADADKEMENPSLDEISSPSPEPEVRDENEQPEEWIREIGHALKEWEPDRLDPESTPSAQAARAAELGFDLSNFHPVAVESKSE